MAEPRPSTDQEDAPLLRNHDEAEQPSGGSNSGGAWAAVTSRTPLEKLLMAIALALLILTSTFIGLFAGAEHKYNKERSKGHSTVTVTATASHTHTATRTSSGEHGHPTGKPDESVCITPECVMLSASILSSLNTDIDPCDDFYEFSTGGWQASHSIPPTKGVFSAFNEVADHNKKIIAEVLAAIPKDKLSHPTDEDENVFKLKAFYDSCLDTDRLNKLGIKPLIPLVNQVLELFGPFDVKSIIDDESAEVKAEWEGTYTEDYTVPDSLRATPIIKRSVPQAVLPAAFEGEFTEDRRSKLTSTLSYLHSRGVEALLSFNIEGDVGGEDPQVQSLWLYQTSGGLPAKQYYSEHKLVDLYHDVVANILFQLANSTDASAASWPWPFPGDGLPSVDKEQERRKRMTVLARKVVEFETALIRAGNDPEYLLNPTYAYNPYSTTKVSKHLPFFDIAWYISTFAPRSFPEQITVTYPPYLHSLSRLISQTPDHVIAGYFATRLALTYAGELGAEVSIRKEYQRLQDVLRGTKPGAEENRQDVCLAAVDGVVGYLAGAEFVKEAFPPAAKKQVEDIIYSIIDAFQHKLPHVAWMDKYSYKAAQKKAAAIVPKIGYPTSPNTTDPTALKMYYGRLKIKSDDLFGNVLRATVLDAARTWSTLGRIRDANTWMEMSPQTVNAYFSPPDNEIVFPAGILQPPFFDPKAPANINYGAFGAVAAHELTHAFDDTGAQYDEKGRLRNWWSNDTIKAFNERAQCIAQQYSQYYMLDAEGHKVYLNGNLTNGENIADSGVAQAYAAWDAHRKKSSTKSIKLPGLSYTEEQIFFLSFGRIWAQLVKPESAVASIRTDPHAPRPWRVKGTVINSKEFHEAFNCKVGDRMRPRHTCDLW